jgi:pimeloyl-ACP methyl ester carboxylesterase
MTQKSNRLSQWILLRGLARESRHWGAFPRILQKSLDEVANSSGLEVRIDCIDLPGSGRFSEMRSPISIAEITEFVRQKFFEIRKRQRDSGQEPAQSSHLVAISLGGMIGTRWLQNWPEDFSSATLINTSFKGFSPVHHRFTAEALRRLALAIASRDMRTREGNVVRLVSNRKDLYEKTTEEWAKIAMSRPITAENFARQLLAAALYQPSNERPGLPLLLLNSVQDRMVNPECSMEISRRWLAEIRRHPTAGHDLPLDDGPWVADQIASWWQKEVLNRR